VRKLVLRTEASSQGGGEKRVADWLSTRRLSGRPDRLDERLCAEDGDHPLQVVGENVKAHLRADLFKGCAAGSGLPHPRLAGPERMFRGLTPHAHARGLSGILCSGP
jgi:hypothetical protein